MTAAQAAPPAARLTAPDMGRSAEALLDLARRKGQAERSVLFGNMTDLLLNESARLSDRERALIGGILQKLISQVEMDIRRGLAERLKSRSDAPAELVALLANDEIEIARPILLESPVLRDPDLMGLIRHRGREHWLAIAGRRQLSPQVTDAIIEKGDIDVIESLLANPNARLSRDAIAYLVAEAERIDRFHAPLVRRHDLPPELAARLYWWVSAALRQHILRSFALDHLVVDEMIEEATRSVVGAAGNDSRSINMAARQLVDALADLGRIDPPTLINVFRCGRVPVFIIGLSRASGVSEAVVRRITLGADGESLALVCKLAEFDRADFAQLLGLLQNAHQGLRPLDPSQPEAMLDLFDDITVENARKVVKLWNRDPDFTAAIDEVSGAGKGRERG